jgi:Uma2 family endonuclease
MILTMREPIIPQFDERQFLNWEAGQEAKFELHRGFVMAFAGGTVDHDTISFNLRAALDRLFPAPCRTFGSDVKVRIAEDTFYYSDAGVVCEEVAGDATIVDGARIVCEVLSRSTRAYDLVEKRAAYRASKTIVAYVIVHTEMRRVEVDARGRNGVWRTETVDDGAALIEGRSLSLADIYARTSVTSE